MGVQSVSTALVKLDLLNSLKADPEYRHAWNLENVFTTVCFQIRALREQRGWSQARMGEQAHMAQERISILEDTNAKTKPTLATLLRLADGLDLGLDVRFVPYGTVIDRSVNTDLKRLEVSSFDDELPEIERQLKEEIERSAASQNLAASSSDDRFWRGISMEAANMSEYASEVTPPTRKRRSRRHSDRQKEARRVSMVIPFSKLRKRRRVGSYPSTEATSAAMSYHRRENIEAQHGIGIPKAS